MTSNALSSLAASLYPKSVPVGPSSGASTGSTASELRQTGAEASFAGMVNDGFKQAHSMEKQSQSAVMDLLHGGDVEVHDAMIATQQAELAFELAMQVRNKAVAAYQQMMQMQF